MNTEMKMTIEKAIVKILKLNSLSHEIDNLEKIMGFASKEIINNKSTSVGQKVDTILNLYLKRPEKVREELEYINKMNGSLKTAVDITEIMRKIPDSILMNPSKTPGDIAEYVWSSVTVKPFDNSDLVFNNVKDSSNAYKLDKEIAKSFNERKYISERLEYLHFEVTELSIQNGYISDTEEYIHSIVEKIPISIICDRSKSIKEIAVFALETIVNRKLENPTQAKESFNPTSSPQDAKDLESELAYKESQNLDELNKLSDKEKMGLIYLAYEQLETSYKDQSKLEIDCIKEFLK